MRKTGFLYGALLLVLGTMLVFATTGTAAGTASFKAAWIYVGPHNDAGWSQAHNEGRLSVQKALGSKVQTTFKENVPEGAQTCQVIESLIRDGNKIIFATSFGFQTCMAQEAKKHPDVYFVMATGTLQTKNMAEYFGAGEDANYLAGIAAGAASKKGTIGLVVAFPIPEVIRHTNAFTLGVQFSNPKAKVKIVWTNNWFDPAKEKKAAESLAAAGADVLAQNVDSPATGQFAQSKGLPWVGYDSDARKFAPTSWLTAPIYNWGPYYTSRVKAAMDGSWKTGFYYGNLKDGFVSLAPYGPQVSAKTKAVIATKRKALVDGSFYEFTGPLYDQKGTLRVPKGKRMTLNEILTMDWLVKGVIGSAKG